MKTDVATATHKQRDDRLVPLLRTAEVPMATLHERYHALLELVRTLIGVVPNCDRYLEIWPPAFRSYNVMVPNFLNLPFTLFGLGGSPRKIVGLGMYAASRAAQCPYCAAHCCSFALRRGSAQAKLSSALSPDSPVFSSAERAVVAVANALGRVPCALTERERRSLESELGTRSAEWTVLGIVMMGFLNKFMDAIGVELEESTFAEVRSTMGADWDPGKADADIDRSAPATAPPAHDSIGSLLRLVPLFPKALAFDAAWQRGVPNRWPAVGEFLRTQTGHDFPVLSRLRARRAVGAIATMLRDNLDATTSVVGLRCKVLAGMIFATAIEDRALGADVRALGPKHGVGVGELDAAAAYASGDRAQPPGQSVIEQTLLRLALAASPSPARITADLVDECRQTTLAPSAIVEIVTWLSVLQMMHRLGSYYGIDQAAAAS